MKVAQLLKEDVNSAKALDIFREMGQHEMKFLQRVANGDVDASDPDSLNQRQQAYLQKLEDLGMVETGGSLTQLGTKMLFIADKFHGADYSNYLAGNFKGTAAKAEVDKKMMKSGGQPEPLEIDLGNDDDVMDFGDGEGDEEDVPSSAIPSKNGGDRTKMNTRRDMQFNTNVNDDGEFNFD